LVRTAGHFIVNAVHRARLDLLTGRDSSIFFWFKPDPATIRVSQGIANFSEHLADVLADPSDVSLACEGVEQYLQVAFHSLLLEDDGMPPGIAAKRQTLLEATGRAPEVLAETALRLLVRLVTRRAEKGEQPFGGWPTWWPAAALVCGWALFVGLLAVVGRCVFGLQSRDAYTLWVVVTFAPVSYSVTGLLTSRRAG